MTKNAERFNKAMKRLLKADWAAKERAAVLRGRKPFAACIDYEALEAKYQSETEKVAQAVFEGERAERRRRVRRQRGW